MLSIVIQAGGLSRRMGQDKGLLPFNGQPLVARVIERVSPLADELIVVTNNPKNYAFLGQSLVSDVYPGRGALGGLFTALNAAAHALVAVVACDMPFASRPLLEAQRNLLLAAQAAAAIPRTEHGLEPFHAVYRRAACLPAVEAALQAGLWRADSWFGELPVHFLESSEIAQYDPRQLAFINVNTPADLQTAQQLAAEEPPDKPSGTQPSA